MKTINSVLLMIGVLGCMALAVDRMVKYYNDNTPFASVGDCVEMVIPECDRFKGIVLQDVSESNSLGLLFRCSKGEDSFIGVTTFPYSDLRANKARVVKCEQIF